MNIYEVTSEVWMEGEMPFGDAPDPGEPTALFEMVVARSRSQARYLAVRASRHFGGSFILEELPRIFIRLVAKDVALEGSVITDAESVWGEYYPDYPGDLAEVEG